MMRPIRKQEKKKASAGTVGQHGTGPVFIFLLVDFKKWSRSNQKERSEETEKENPEEGCH